MASEKVKEVAKDCAKLTVASTGTGACLSTLGSIGIVGLGGAIGVFLAFVGGGIVLLAGGAYLIGKHTRGR